MREMPLLHLEKGEFDRMKKKLVLSFAFILSLTPMLLHQYGGMKGVQEISGLINLLNPIGILSVILFAAGVWMPHKKQIANKTLCIAGTAGIVAAELYQFFTWHVMNITGELSLSNSLKLAFPAFYFGLAVSLLMIAVYFVIEKKMNVAAA